MISLKQSNNKIFYDTCSFLFVTFVLKQQNVPVSCKNRRGKLTLVFWLLHYSNTNNITLFAQLEDCASVLHYEPISQRFEYGMQRFTFTCVLLGE